MDASNHSSFGDISFAYDGHTWDQIELRCPIEGPGGKTHHHFLKCSACGLERHPFAEPGNHHYFVYYRDGIGDEFVPPCTRAYPKEAEVVVDLIEICEHCRDRIEYCRRSEHRNPTCEAAKSVHIPFCRNLRPRPEGARHTGKWT